MDINVTGVWERNVTGQGVTVVVVDDGVEHTIKDIQPNYVSGCPPLPQFKSMGWRFPFSTRKGSGQRKGSLGWVWGAFLGGWLSRPR